MVHQEVVCLLSISAMFSWIKTSWEGILDLIQFWSDITVLQSCSLIDITIKLDLSHSVDDSPPLEWEPSNFPRGGH